MLYPQRHKSSFLGSQVAAAQLFEGLAAPDLDCVEVGEETEDL